MHSKVLAIVVGSILILGLPACGSAKPTPNSRTLPTSPLAAASTPNQTQTSTTGQAKPSNLSPVDAIVFICGTGNPVANGVTRCAGVSATASKAIVQSRLDSDPRVAGYRYDASAGRFSVTLHSRQQSSQFLRDYLFADGVAWSFDCNQFGSNLRPPTCGPA